MVPFFITVFRFFCLVFFFFVREVGSLRILIDRFVDSVEGNLRRGHEEQGSYPELPLQDKVALVPSSQLVVWRPLFI